MSSLFLSNVMTIGSCVDVYILSHENDNIYSRRYNYQYLILNKRKTIPKGQSKIQRNWQHMVHKTKKNKSKTQHNMCWTSLYTNNTNNVDKT